MSDDTIGSLVAGRYRILSSLGEGAMGIVYRALQLDADGQPLRDVALKTIQPRLSFDEAFAKRFLREIRVMARLRSGSAVTVYDAGRTEDGRLFFSMELLGGGTLRDLLRSEGALPASRVTAIAAQICEALAEAHGQAEPIVHRDLKPSNVFVEAAAEGDRVKVADFGVAKILGEETTGLTHTGTSPGTPLYMAPEQWTGKDLDGRADLYALGVMMFEMLTGRPPFTGSLETLLYKHLSEDPRPQLEPLANPLRAVLARLLSKNPKERYPNALAVRAAILAAVDERSGASPSVLSKEPGHRVSLPRWAALGAAAAGALALAAGAWYASPPSLVEISRGEPTPVPWTEPTVPPAPPTEPTVTAREPTPAGGAKDPSVSEPVGPGIEELLVVAKAQLDRDHLTTPRGDNAFGTYQQILDRDPENESARSGIRDIKDEYLRRARDAERHADRDRAAMFYRKALFVDPGDEGIRRALERSERPPTRTGERWREATSDDRRSLPAPVASADIYVVNRTPWVLKVELPGHPPVEIVSRGAVTKRLRTGPQSIRAEAGEIVVFVWRSLNLRFEGTIDVRPGDQIRLEEADFR